MVKLLLKYGADVRDHDALVSAANLGHMVLVKTLLDAGASPNGRASIGTHTALQVASGRGFLGVAQRLIDAGADINARGRVYDDVGLPEWYVLEFTALALAALNGRLEILHLLLSRGAAVHGPAGRGQYIDAVRAATSNFHGAAATLLKSFGGWTDLDEQALRAKYMAAAAAAKAKYNSASGSDGCLKEVTGETSTQASSDCSLSTPQGDVGDDTTTSTEFPKEPLISDWPEDSAEQGDTVNEALHTEFSDFFLEELRRLQGYAGEDDGWCIGCELFAG